MCELFGLSCNKAVDISFSFTKFKSRSKGNPHGWGVGFYRKNDSNNQNYATIIKEPIPAQESIFKDFLRNNIKSNIFISHVRWASSGSHVPLNTHPFELMLDPRSDANANKEKSWIFAHNGTIDGIKANNSFKSIIGTHGNTDSEYAFCYIMQRLRKKYQDNGYDIKTKEKIQIIQKAADEISQHYPESLNFVMSDGYRLYSYYSGYDGSGGLWHLTRKPPHKEFSVEDKEDGMVIKFIKLRKANDEIASVVATKPLTEEDWKEFKPNELKVFENGELLKL